MNTAEMMTTEELLMLEGARALAQSMGPLMAANDGTMAELAMAAANVDLMQREVGTGRFAWHNDRTCSDTNQAYFRRSDGFHGWFCVGCRGITQVG